MDPEEALYDEASTIYSPDGRLLQVEYALKAVKKGSTILGLKYNKGIILIAYKEQNSILIDINSVEKIFEIDKNIFCAITGIAADARLLVDLARTEAQIYNLWYGEKITLKQLVESIGETLHLYTQFDGIRPFGTTLLIAGLNNSEEKIYATDPSGAFFSYRAFCAGKGSEIASSILEKQYNPKFLRSDDQ